MTTMQKVYEVYCDESGTFRTVDTHVICPLIVEDNAIGQEAMTGVWKQIFPEGSWETFHATELKIAIVQKVFDQMVSHLFQHRNISAAYIFHKNERDYGVDFYHDLLFEFFLWFADVILRRENRYYGNGNRVVANLKISLAERGPVDTLKFRETLQVNLNRLVSDYHQQHHLPPDNFSFQIFVYVMPAFRNPFIQVSDLLSYVVRAWLNGHQTFSPGSVRYLEAMQRTEALKEVLITDKIKALSGKDRRDNVITLVVNREKLVQAPAAPVEVSFSRMLLSGLSGWIQETEGVLDKRMQGLVEKLMRHDRMYQMAETDQIRLTAEAMTTRTREFAKGAFLVQFLQRYIEKARLAADGPLPSYLNRLEVQAAVLYLGVNNHQGHFPLNDECIRKAEASADMLKRDPAFWPLVCDFNNNMAVSLHNIFDFTGASQRLHALIEHLETELKNPFTGSAVKCYEIGALFGSYAQTLAFEAHCSFFRLQNNAVLRRQLEEAEYYSCQAMEHFDDPADHERQITYQTHFNLQAYILTGEKTCLEKAAALLNSDGKTDAAIETLITSCPERSMLNPAYRVSAALKYGFLSETSYSGTPDMVETILKHRDILPSCHPMEQLLPYLIMTEKRAEYRKRLRNTLEHLKFPPNIVRTIQWIMQLQTAFYLKEPLALADIRKVADSLTPDIEPQWRRYGLLQVLEEYTRTPERWHVGPMEVLPFNYC